MSTILLIFLSFAVGIVIGIVVMLIKYDNRFGKMIFGDLVKDGDSLYIQLNDEESYRKLDESKYAMFKIIRSKSQK